MKMTEEDLLTQYYLNQAGSGIGDFYSGPIYQRGYGIGSFLGGLFRSILPLLKKTGVSIGKEVLNSGSNFIDDLNHSVNPRIAFDARAKETLQKIKNRLLTGGGVYKVAKRGKKRQLSKNTRSVKTKRAKIENDIFSK